MSEGRRGQFDGVFGHAGAAARITEETDHRHSGDRERARQHLTTAIGMYREMPMTYWPEQAEAELSQLG
jgi:hypothetical protein